MTASSGAVVNSIDNISSISEENAAAAQEVSASTEEMTAQIDEMAASAQTLSAMAVDLQKLAGQFKLKTESYQHGLDEGRKLSVIHGKAVAPARKAS
jgi:phage-related tail protein